MSELWKCTISISEGENGVGVVDDYDIDELIARLRTIKSEEGEGAAYGTLMTLIGVIERLKLDILSSVEEVL